MMSAYPPREFCQNKILSELILSEDEGECGAFSLLPTSFKPRFRRIALLFC